MRTRTVLLLTLFFALMLSTAVWAQSATEKGRIISDADLLFSSVSSDVDDEWDSTSDHSTLETDIRVGYTVIDDLVVGVGLTVDNTSSEIKNEFHKMEQADKMLLFDVFARYYFMPDSQIRPFAGATVGFGNIAIEVTGAEDSKYNVFNYGVAAGAAYFFNEHWGVELVYHLTKESYSENDDHAYTEDTDGLANTIAFGLIFSFGL